MTKPVCLTAATLVLSALLGAAAAQAQEGTGILGNMFQTIFGGGSAGPSEVEYRERPPLVVPPRSSLPAPQERASARNTANWPNDPDVLRKRKAAQADDEIYLFSDRARMQRDRGELRLSNDELARGRIAAQSAANQPLGGLGDSILDDRNTRAMLLTPIQQMKQADALQKAAAAEVPTGVEPPRRFLTQPPSGLRQPTQKVAAPREAPIERQADNDLGIRTFQRQQQAN